VISCVLETIKLFQFHGFKVSLVVYDGASSNISAIKASHNYHGAYLFREFRRGDSISFGWKTITDFYKRELARVDQGCTRMVPRLKEAHCLRDAWTNT